MGDNSIDNSHEYEDAWGEYFDDAYEGGTGYSYNDPLYDIDEQPEPNQQVYDNTSSDFTNYAGTDDYMVGGGQDDKGEGNEADNDGQYDSRSRVENEDFNGGEEEEKPDNFDGEDDGAGENDADEDEKDNEEDGADDTDGQDGKQGDVGTQGRKKQLDGPIKWKPGDEITLPLLSQVWKECRHIEQVRPLTESANKAITEAINSLGPNLMLRLNNYISKIADNDLDTIGCLLDLASKNGKRLTYTALSVLESIFDQQWTQTTMLATLPTVLKTVIAVDPVKGILNKIFKIAVPLINLKHRKK